MMESGYHAGSGALMSSPSAALCRVDLSPVEYTHVPQAPRIERRVVLAPGSPDSLQVGGGGAVEHRCGVAPGGSNHTLAHRDAPVPPLAGGHPLDCISPAQQLASANRGVCPTAVKA